MAHTQRRELTIRRKGLRYFINTLLAQARQVVQWGVRESLREQFVEVKIVPGQEIDSVRLEEHGLVVHLRPWEHIEAEGPRCVFALTVVPLKRADADLEGLEFSANIFQFLVALF